MDGSLEQEHVLRRREAFETFVTRSSLGLEIGPSYMPTFPKRDGWNVLTLDTGSREELYRLFSQDADVDAAGVEAMEEVDLIDRGEGLIVAASHRAPFDYIVACHVIEHVPDLVAFLRDCAALLDDEGVLLLAVPTRELSFDFFRPLSTPGDVVLATQAADAFTARSIVDDMVIRAELDGAVAWLPWQLEVALRDGRSPTAGRGSSALPESLADSVLDESPRPESWTGHRWVFEPPTFRFLMEFIAQAYSVPMRLRVMTDGMGSEFLAVLEKTAVQTAETPRFPTFDDGSMQAYAARQSVLVPTHPARRANDVMFSQLIHYKNLARRLEQRLDELLGSLAVRSVARLVRTVMRR